MRNRISSVLIALLASAPLAIPAQPGGWYTEGDYAPANRISLTLVNTLDRTRPDCPVVVPRNMFPFANVTSREVIVVDPSLPSRPEPSREEKLQYGGHLPRGEKNGAWIPYQLDDLDCDGMWDEL